VGTLERRDLAAANAWFISNVQDIVDTFPFNPSVSGARIPAAPLMNLL